MTEDTLESTHSRRAGRRSRHPNRRSRPRLTRDVVTAAALALIDEAGIGAFSMRKLGARLGVDPMAVYHYFADQEALFDAIAEALFDEVGIDSLPWQQSWRDLLEQLGRRLRDVLRRHPHAVTIFATRPVRSDAAVEAGNRTVTILRDAGFGPGLDLQVFRCVREFTLGHAIAMAQVQLGATRRSRKPPPGSPGYGPLAESADTREIDGHFEIGLRALLDGFERLIDDQTFAGP